MKNIGTCLWAAIAAGGLATANIALADTIEDQAELKRELSETLDPSKPPSENFNI